MSRTNGDDRRREQSREQSGQRNGQRNGSSGRNRASDRRNHPDRRNPYRFSFRFIDRWEKRLKKWIWIGVGVGAALFGVGLILGGTMDGDVPDEDPLWNLVWGVIIAGGAVAVLSLLVPLGIAFVLGGLSIHRYGWIPGLMTFVGILALATGGALDEDVLGEWLDRWLTQAGLGVLVAGVLGFFLVGHLAKVPMTIAGIRVDSGRNDDRDASA